MVILKLGLSGVRVVVRGMSVGDGVTLGVKERGLLLELKVNGALGIRGTLGVKSEWYSWYHEVLLKLKEEGALGIVGCSWS